MKLFPSTKQWKGWSFPSKLTAVGTYLGVITFIVGITMWIFPSEYFANKTYNKESIYDSSKNFEIIIDSVTVNYSKKDTGDILEFHPNAHKQYNIVYPKITYANNTYVEGKINKSIVDFFNSWYVDLNNLNQSKWSGEIDCSYEIAYKIDNLLGIRFNLYWYGTGAAHGNQSVITYNINVKNGKRFNFQDIFSETSAEEIKQILLKRIKDYDCYCIDENVDFEYRNERNFYFDYDGINIVFSKYEVACGVCGPIVIKLLYTEVDKYINPHGPLEFL